MNSPHFGPLEPYEPTFTHYSYLTHPESYREPTCLFDLSMAGPETKRDLVGALIERGELLSAVPGGVVITSTDQLREFLKGQRAFREAAESLRKRRGGDGVDDGRDLGHPREF
jgi:hypothetical protein